MEQSNTNNDKFCGTTHKVCKYCESSSQDCTTGKLYCYDVSPLRFLLLGGRRVQENGTCKRWAMHNKFKCLGR